MQEYLYNVMSQAPFPMFFTHFNLYNNPFSNENTETRRGKLTSSTHSPGVGRISGSRILNLKLHEKAKNH